MLGRMTKSGKGIKKRGKGFLVWLVIILFVNLPVVSALEISNVRAEEITEKGAVVKWETDEAADSFVGYGKEKVELATEGDAKLVKEHAFALGGLEASTTYYYKVKSGEVEEDNGGELYSFETLEPDVTAPLIEVEIPEIVAGEKLNVEGKTEAGAEVRIFVGGKMRDRLVAGEEGKEEGIIGAEEENSEKEAIRGEAISEGGKSELKGKFSFEVFLSGEEWNEILVEAEDKSGNIGSWKGRVFADTKKPKIELEELPELVDGNEISVKGTVSEESSIEILANNRSVFKGKGESFEEKVSLQEGENTIKISVRDEAGWEAVKELKVEADTRAPQVSFELAGGGEYYQGRAETDISGETEPGAKVYLYVYRPLGYEYKPDFGKAWKEVTANEKGEFSFEEIDFECLTCGLKELKPKEVPSGLLETSIFPVEAVKEAQQWTYHIYIIAEDKTGKIGYGQRTAQVKTCYSADWAFDVTNMIRFQAPLRLDPGLLDEGRETITAVFNFSYHGKGQAKYDPATGQEIEPAFKITGVRFERACTQGMLEDEAFKVGCKLLPNNPSGAIPNGDKTAYFLTWSLHGAKELSKAEESFWNEFKKRRVMFPLKITISYQERLGEAAYSEERREEGYTYGGTYGGYGGTYGGGYGGTYGGYGGGWSMPKSQTSCYDLGYSVDIPLDSQKMIPDFLANEGVKAMEEVINKIELVMPYLEYAILGTGVGCITGFLGRMAVSWVRMVTSKLEVWFTLTKPEGERCPANQNGLYLESTIKNWQAMDSGKLTGDVSLPADYANQKLEDKCPQTAKLWETEAILDQVYRWSCDRVFCRKVPAGWTEEADENKIGSVVLKQSQCAAVSATGIPLTKRENCQELIKVNMYSGQDKFWIENAPDKVKETGGVCWQSVDGTLYIYDQNKLSDEEKEKTRQGFYKLTPVFRLMGDVAPAKETLVVYKPEGAESFMVAKDRSCESVCRSGKAGYKADTSFSIIEDGKQKGCYYEDIDNVTNQIVFKDGKEELLNTEKAYSAGYTNDCFVELDKNNPTGKMKQCVCVTDEKAKKKYYSEGVLRTAAAGESWDYREATIFAESHKQRGTYYPEWRYYKGRDFSGAFGADYLLDYAREDKEEAAVDPFGQHIGAFQSLCLSGIRARLLMLKNILTGLKNCIQEAKYTSLQDAGMCKTMFAQHVCGLIYKAIAYFFSGCSPYTFDDAKKEGTFEDVKAVFGAGLGSIDQAMGSSISRIQEDYGNAKLNEFFATGTKGFAQSMCMAAFGFDWPMGFDFIKDAAYAVPMKTSVFVPLPERELASYNPAKGTAIYNYRIPVSILPGCSIRSYKVYLKCIGAEDLGAGGVDCGSQGCDCVRSQGRDPLEAEKIYYLQGGMGFDLKSGTVKDVPIPAPQKVDSHYRYDHVVVELQLDRYENSEACFDEGYRDGKFYFPVRDVSAPGEVSCQVETTTGRYFCPELSGFFGKMGLAYLEEPYLSCWNKKTQGWVSCDTPNLFMLNGEIKVKAHLVTDGKGQCLKMVLGGMMVPLERLRQVPENIPGPLYPEYNLGMVNEDMLRGMMSSLALVPLESNPGCRGVKYENAPAMVSTSGGRISFNYLAGAGGTYQLLVPDGVQVLSSEFKKGDGNYLIRTRDNVQDLALMDINGVVFETYGFRVSNVLGEASLSSQPQACVYQVSGGGALGGQQYRDLPITLTLLMQDETGGCYYAKQPVSTAMGRSSATVNIRVQKEEMAIQERGEMHKAFMGGNYDFVESTAKNTLQRRKGDSGDALAVYYLVAVDIMNLVAVDIMKGSQQGNSGLYKADIQNLLKIFFERTDMAGQAFEPYDEATKGSKEYKKINCYLCLIAENQFSGKYSSECAGACSTDTGG